MVALNKLLDEMVDLKQSVMTLVDELWEYERRQGWHEPPTVASRKRVPKGGPR